MSIVSLTGGDTPAGTAAAAAPHRSVTEESSHTNGGDDALFGKTRAICLEQEEGKSHHVGRPQEGAGEGETGAPALASSFPPSASLSSSLLPLSTSSSSFLLPPVVNTLTDYAPTSTAFGDLDSRAGLDSGDVLQTAMKVVAVPPPPQSSSPAKSSRASSPLSSSSSLSDSDSDDDYSSLMKRFVIDEHASFRRGKAAAAAASLEDGKYPPSFPYLRFGKEMGDTVGVDALFADFDRGFISRPSCFSSSRPFTPPLSSGHSPMPPSPSFPLVGRQDSFIPMLKFELESERPVDPLDESFEGLLRRFNIDPFSTNLLPIRRSSFTPATPATAAFSPFPYSPSFSAMGSPSSRLDIFSLRARSRSRSISRSREDSVHSMVKPLLRRRVGNSKVSRPFKQSHRVNDSSSRSKGGKPPKGFKKASPKKPIHRSTMIIKLPAIQLATGDILQPSTLLKKRKSPGGKRRNVSRKLQFPAPILAAAPSSSNPPVAPQTH